MIKILNFKNIYEISSMKREIKEKEKKYSRKIIKKRDLKGKSIRITVSLFQSQEKEKEEKKTKEEKIKIINEIEEKLQKIKKECF